MFVIIETSKKGTREFFDFDSESLAQFYADKMNVYKPQNIYTVGVKVGA